MRDENVHGTESGLGPNREGRGAGPEASSVPPEVYRRAANPSHLGDIPMPDGYAHVRGDCGDTLEIFLQIRDRRIESARFDALGCGFTLACGNVAAELAEGRTVAEALRIDPQAISRALGGLPPSHEHCAELAAEGLRKAIEDHLYRRNEPWKKLYRNR